MKRVDFEALEKSLKNGGVQSGAFQRLRKANIKAPSGRWLKVYKHRKTGLRVVQREIKNKVNAVSPIVSSEKEPDYFYDDILYMCKQAI